MATMGSGPQAPMQTATYRPVSSPQKSQVETLYQRSADLGKRPTPWPRNAAGPCHDG